MERKRARILNITNIQNSTKNASTSKLTVMQCDRDEVSYRILEFSLDRQNLIGRISYVFGESLDAKFVNSYGLKSSAFERNTAPGAVTIEL